ncbi:MAG: OadG family protein [Anaerolineae bacterium]
MAESLAQALELTVLGMGMTFGAILVLILFMYLMTYLTRQRSTTSAAGLGGDGAMSVGEEMAEMRHGGDESATLDRVRRQRAAAAAVAVAMALGERIADVKPAADAEAAAAWDIYMRTRHLSQRVRYESRKHF